MLTSVTCLTTSARLTPIALTVGAPSHAGVGTATKTSPQTAQEVYAELTDLVNFLFFLIYKCLWHLHSKYITEKYISIDSIMIVVNNK